MQFRRWCSKYKPSLSIVPIFFTIFPENSIFTIVIILAEILCCNFLVEKKMIKCRSSPLISNRHQMAAYNFSLFLWLGHRFLVFLLFSSWGSTIEVLGVATRYLWTCISTLSPKVSMSFWYLHQIWAWWVVFEHWLSLGCYLFYDSCMAVSIREWIFKWETRYLLVFDLYNLFDWRHLLSLWRCLIIILFSTWPYWLETMITWLPNTTCKGTLEIQFQIRT